MPQPSCPGFGGPNLAVLYVSSAAIEMTPADLAKAPDGEVTGESLRPMLRALREGKGLALLIDQNVGTDDRIFVEFFGKPASTTPALALLKLKTDCSLIPSFAQPLPGNRFRFNYGAPIEIPRTGNRQEDVHRITQACTTMIEEQIRRGLFSLHALARALKAKSVSVPRRSAKELSNINTPLDWKAAQAARGCASHRQASGKSARAQHLH